MEPLLRRAQRRFISAAGKGQLLLTAGKFSRVGQQLLQCLTVDVGQAVIADLSGSLQFVQLAHHIRNGRSAVAVVDHIDVDIIGIQPPETALQRLLDIIR